MRAQIYDHMTDDIIVLRGENHIASFKASSNKAINENFVDLLCVL